jgi:hypothetical protein
MPEPPTPAAPAALERFLAEARAFEPEQILPFRADPRTAQQSVAIGVAAVLTWADHVREHLPHVDLGELRSLPDLALYLADAAREADPAADTPETRELLAEAHALRRRLRSATIALLHAGILAPRELAKVGPDHGAVDVAADCAALATLFEKRADDIEGQTPVSPEQLARAAELAATLKALFKPKAGARRPGPTGISPVEARDRLWTLLVTRHERLWAVGAYIYGHSVDEHVPPLHAPPPPAKGRKAEKPRPEEG